MSEDAGAPRLPLEGGCQCGGLRYLVKAPPLTLYCCHCSECQAQSASAFGMSLLVARAALETDWGACRSWSRPTASGGSLACRFCPGCGSRLFHIGSASPEIVSVKAGSLDRRDLPPPVGHIWTASAQTGSASRKGHSSPAASRPTWRRSWSGGGNAGRRGAAIDAGAPGRHKGAKDGA